MTTSMCEMIEPSIATTRGSTSADCLGNRCNMGKGTEFEKLIAHLEKGLRGRNFRIEHDAKLLDVDTGTERQVDVLVEEYLPDGGRIQTAIECRDRKHKDDITWIEGLISKRTSIGVSEIIGVSSSGFTKPARVKAEKHGVYLRTYREFENDTALEQFPKGACYSVVRNLKPLELHLLFDNTTKKYDDENEQNVQHFIDHAMCTNSILIETPDKRNQLTPRDIINRSIEHRGFEIHRSISACPRNIKVKDDVEFELDYIVPIDKYFTIVKVCVIGYQITDFIKRFHAKSRMTVYEGDDIKRRTGKKFYINRRFNLGDGTSEPREDDLENETKK